MPLALLIVLPTLGVILLSAGIILVVALASQDSVPPGDLVQQPADPAPGPGQAQNPPQDRNPGADLGPDPDQGPLGQAPLQVPLTRTIQASPTCVWGVAFTADGSTLVTGDGHLRQPGQVKLWQSATGFSLGTLLDPKAEVEGAAFSPDGNLVACASTDQGLQLYDRVNRRIKAAARHPSYVRAVAFSPDGKRLASSCEQTLKVWDLTTLLPSWSVNLPKNDLRAWRIGVRLAFSPDSKTLAAGDGGNNVHLYDAATGKQTGTCSGHTGIVLCTAFSPDGKYLVSGSFDKTVKVWDSGTRLVRSTLTGHTDWVFCVAVASDGKTLASAGREGSVILWDMPNGRKLTTLAAHPRKEAVCVAFSPDGKTLATSGADGTVKLWDVSRVVGRR
jgi:WD40 repeat protein